MARALREYYTGDKAVIITAIISEMSCESVTAARRGANSRLILSHDLSFDRHASRRVHAVVPVSSFETSSRSSRETTNFLITVSLKKTSSPNNYSIHGGKFDCSLVAHHGIFIGFFTDYPVPRPVYPPLFLLFLSVHDKFQDNRETRCFDEISVNY